MGTDIHPNLNAADPRVKAAEEAEKNLFKHYNLDYEEKYIEMNKPKIRLRVLEVGSGPPVLMVPGGVGDAWIFASLIKHLAGYRVIAVNRPGGGMSEGIDHRAVDIRQLAVDSLTTVVDYYNLDSVPVIGNSMGGLWSFWFALARSERVSALIQLGTPALILETSAPFPMRLLSLPRLNRRLVKMTIPKTYDKVRGVPAFLGHPREVGANWPESEAACGYHFTRLPTYETSWLSLLERVATLRGGKADVQFREEELRKVRQPTLLIWGSKDPFGNLDTAQRANEALPNAELHEVGFGHNPWWDNAQKCAALINGFLSKYSSIAKTG